MSKNYPCFIGIEKDVKSPKDFNRIIPSTIVEQIRKCCVDAKDSMFKRITIADGDKKCSARFQLNADDQLALQTDPNLKYIVGVYPLVPVVTTLQDIAVFLFVNARDFKVSGTTSRYLFTGKLSEAVARVFSNSSLVQTYKVDSISRVVMNADYYVSLSGVGSLTSVVDRIIGITATPSATTVSNPSVPTMTPVVGTTPSGAELQVTAEVKQRQRVSTVRLKRDYAFRAAVLSARGNTCYFTGQSLTEVPSDTGMEVAHIHPVSEDGLDVVANGIVLLPDIHKLFDQNSIVLAADGRLWVSNFNKPSRAHYSFLRTSVSVTKDMVPHIERRNKGIDFSRYHMVGAQMTLAI